MKKVLVLATAILVAFSTAAFCAADTTKVKPPMIKTAMITDVSLSKHWKLGANVVIPPLRIQQSVRKNATFDAVLNAMFGGGLDFVYYSHDAITGKDEEVFSFSPVSFFLSGNSVEDVKNIDVSWGATASFFGGALVTGIGYNFGNNVFQDDLGNDVAISRWFWMLGYGVALK